MDAWEHTKRPVGRQRRHESPAVRRQAWNEIRRAQALSAKKAVTYAASNETVIGACTVSDPVERDELGRIKVEAPPGASGLVAACAWDS
jgi:hypothetical protein